MGFFFVCYYFLFFQNTGYKNKLYLVEKILDKFEINFYNKFSLFSLFKWIKCAEAYMTDVKMMEIEMWLDMEIRLIFKRLH